MGLIGGLGHPPLLERWSILTINVRFHPHLWSGILDSNVDTRSGRFSRRVPPGGCPVEDAGHETMHFVWPGITSESFGKSWRKYVEVREVWASDPRLVDQDEAKHLESS